VGNWDIPVAVVVGERLPLASSMMVVVPSWEHILVLVVLLVENIQLKALLTY
jgi:hypothetical protein